MAQAKKSLDDLSPEEIKRMKKEMAGTMAETAPDEEEQLKETPKAKQEEVKAAQKEPRLDPLSTKVVEQLMDEVANLKKQLNASTPTDYTPKYDGR